MTDVKVRVTGLRELQRALKTTGEKTPKAIQSSHKVVADIVVTDARKRAAGTTLGPRIRASGTTRTAAVRFLGHKRKGKSSTSDAMLQEFGGRAPLFGNRDHWHTVKARNKQGYLIYPAIRATRGQVMARYMRELDRSVAAHFNR